MSRARSLLVIALCLCFGGGVSVGRAQTPAKPDARVFFQDLKDGAVVPSKFTLHFGASNIDVVPAGNARPFAGHHHLLIDAPLPDLNKPIPSDPNHLHFGRGQTEAEVILSAGEHTLQLLMGDHDHIPHKPPVMSEVVRVRVDPATVERPRTPAPQGAQVFFVGLEDGATVPTKSTVKFGVSGIELAHAGDRKPNTGHHHLIIDAPTPDASREIPSDLNHIHFGRGQTQTDLTLTPGPHTLQLVLGDGDHVPHDPPIVSKIIHVTAVDSASAQPAAQAPAQEGRTPSPPDAVVYFVYPRNGMRIYPHSTIRFGLRNMGVAPAGVTKPNTGHHHLIIDAPTPALDRPIPSDAQHLHFGVGQTEKKIALKPGKHTLQLVLGDAQHIPHDPPVVSDRIEVMVGFPRRHRRR